jgi:hypothetical protein
MSRWRRPEDGALGDRPLVRLATLTGNLVGKLKQPLVILEAGNEALGYALQPDQRP